MRKILAVTAVLAFMMCAGLASRAQEATSETIANANAAKEVHGQPDRPVHPYRLDFSVNELEDGKKINTRQYSMNLNSDDADEIKIGTRSAGGHRARNVSVLGCGHQHLVPDRRTSGGHSADGACRRQ